MSHVMTLNAIRLERDIIKTTNSITNRFNEDKVQELVKWDEKLRNLLATVMDYELNMRKDKRYSAKKPVFAIGDSVMVAEHNMPDHWKYGRIVAYDDEDGPSRVYHVRLKNGQRQQVNNIEGHQVMLDKEYFISKHVKESVWKGVQRVVLIRTVRSMGKGSWMVCCNTWGDR